VIQETPEPTNSARSLHLTRAGDARVTLARGERAFRSARLEQWLGSGLADYLTESWQCLRTVMSKSILDWVLLGANPVRPAGCFCGLSLTAPTSVASNEVATASGYARQTALFAAAVTTAGAAVTTAGNVGSASNSAAMTVGPFSSSAVISGMFLADNRPLFSD
jgi:hypothetical protein